MNTVNDAKVMFIVTKEVILRLKEIFMPNNDFEVEKETAKHILLLRNTTVKTTTPLDLPIVIQAKNYNACINSATVAKVFK